MSAVAAPEPSTPRTSPIVMAMSDSMQAQLEAALPLGGVTGSDEFPYFTGGTSFLVRWRGRLWLITAEHALRDKPLETFGVRCGLPSLEMTSTRCS